MASIDSKVICPTCGATSKTPGFGQGRKDVLKPYPKPDESNPVTNERRRRARAIRAQNNPLGKQ